MGRGIGEEEIDTVESQASRKMFDADSFVNGSLGIYTHGWEGVEKEEFLRAVIYF